MAALGRMDAIVTSSQSRRLQVWNIVVLVGAGTVQPSSFGMSSQSPQINHSSVRGFFHKVVEELRLDVMEESPRLQRLWAVGQWLWVREVILLTGGTKWPPIQLHFLRASGG